MMVRDKMTGRWYDPHIEFEKLMNEGWVAKIMKRLKFI